MPQVTYQQGVNGYNGTLDTMLTEYGPNTTHASETSLSVDGDDDGRGADQVLLRFDDLFGSGSGQIPLGAHITSATLTLQTTNPGSGAELHRMLTAWDGTSTWDSMGSGLQADGHEAAANVDLDTESVTQLGPTTLNVTASLQAWADGASNYGWAILPVRHDGWDFDSSEGAVAPKLTVEYTVDGTKPPPENSAPIASNDTYSTTMNQALTIDPLHGVLANDIDADTGASALAAITVAEPSHGTLALNTDGSFTYTPASGYSGSDSFSYKVNDGSLDSNTATVALKITGTTPPPDNIAPKAADDSASTKQDTAVRIAVLANDSDQNNDTLTVTAATDPSHGSATINQDGSITYTPAANYLGDDSFVYTVSDGHGGTDTATVKLAVTPSTPPPTEAHTYDHVFVVFMENHSASEIYSNPDAPFINDVLRGSGETFTNMHGVARPSQPNYLAFYSGSTQGVTDNDPHSFGSTPTLGDQFAAAGLSLVWEAESGTRPNHLPTTSFNDSAYNRSFASDWPKVLSDLANAPDFVAVSPDQIHSMHDGTVAEGDSWLRANFSSVIDFVKNPANNSLFVLTYDEPNTSASLNTPIPTVAVGAGIGAGTSDNTNVNLYSLLQEFEQQHNFTRLGSAATAPDMILG